MLRDTLLSCTWRIADHCKCLRQATQQLGRRPHFQLLTSGKSQDGVRVPPETPGKGGPKDGCVECSQGLFLAEGSRKGLWGGGQMFHPKAFGEKSLLRVADPIGATGQLRQATQPALNQKQALKPPDGHAGDCGSLVCFCLLPAGNADPGPAVAGEAAATSRSLAGAEGGVRSLGKRGSKYWVWGQSPLQLRRHGGPAGAKKVSQAWGKQEKFPSVAQSRHLRFNHLIGKNKPPVCLVSCTLQNLGSPNFCSLSVCIVCL